MFFCELVVAEKGKLGSSDPMNFTFIDTAVANFPELFAKFLA